jgi:hypothetical protein
MNSLTQPMADDRYLVAQIAKGDKRALEALYTQYQRPVFAYLLQLTSDYGLAEEILQDTQVAGIISLLTTLLLFAILLPLYVSAIRLGFLSASC